MTLLSHRLSRLAAAIALLAAIAVGVAPAALADDWARDRAHVIAYQELDPAIRTAIEARAPASPAASLEPTLAAPASPSGGFAWGAAALGLLIGVGATCLTLACVTLVRHDGHLRSA
jgi:hypothetical protein